MLKESRIVEYERSMARSRRLNRQATDMSIELVMEEEDQWELSDQYSVVKSWKGEDGPPPLEQLLCTTLSSKSQNMITYGKSNQKRIKKDIERDIAHHIQWLHYAVTTSLPQLQSRIINTSNMLFQEIAKGYFLPFCSIAIGILARIRTIILRWGREAVAQCMEVINSLVNNEKYNLSRGLRETVTKHCLVDSSIWMKEFMEVESSWNIHNVRKENVNNRGSKMKDRSDPEGKLILNENDEKKIMEKIGMHCNNKSKSRNANTQQNISISFPLSSSIPQDVVNETEKEDLGESINTESRDTFKKIPFPNTLKSKIPKRTEIHKKGDSSKKSKKSLYDVGVSESKECQGETKETMEQENSGQNMMQVAQTTKDKKGKKSSEYKKKKKRKKTKDGNEKKKRKKLKGTKDIFDEIFDGL